jgi:lipopolysaccharide heptosyltransferase II
LQSAKRNSARLSLLRLAARALSPAVRRRPTHVRRVLLLRPDHIGDVLLTAPAVALLRTSLPSAHLSYAVGPWSREAAEHGPPVDDLLVVPFPGFTRHPASLQAPYTLLAREATRLRRERYDVAVILRPDHWWGALLALAAGIPVRVGGDTPETTRLLTHARARKPGEHWAEQALSLAHLTLEVCGVSPAQLNEVRPFTISGLARTEAAAIWKRHALDSRQVVAMQPSAGAPLKSWPVANWVKLADRCIELKLAVLLMGGPDDAPLLNTITQRMAHPASARLCGQSLDLSAALYARCRLLIGLDGGAAHLAAAVGTPTVRLYGPTSTEVFGPWPHSDDQRALLTDTLDCVPCGRLEAPPCGAVRLPACLLALGVDDVMKAVSLQLAQG